MSISVNLHSFSALKIVSNELCYNLSFVIDLWMNQIFGESSVIIVGVTLIW